MPTHPMYSTSTNLDRLKSPKCGFLRGTFWDEWFPPPSGMILTRIPEFPAANVAFSPAELDERIANHAARVEQLPRDLGCSCWCCGIVAGSGAALRKLGWRWRELPWYPGLTETYCDECFEKWGFP